MDELHNLLVRQNVPWVNGLEIAQKLSVLKAGVGPQGSGINMLSVNFLVEKVVAYSHVLLNVLYRRNSEMRIFFLHGFLIAFEGFTLVNVEELTERRKATELVFELQLPVLVKTGVPDQEQVPRSQLREPQQVELSEAVVDCEVVDTLGPESEL